MPGIQPTWLFSSTADLYHSSAYLDGRSRTREKEPKGSDEYEVKIDLFPEVVKWQLLLKR